MTVVQLISRYCAYAKKEYHPCEAEKAGRLRDIVRSRNCQVSDFGPLRLKAIQRSMIHRKWCRSYINSQIHILKRIFKWGVSEEIVDVNVYLALTCVRGVRKGKAREAPPILPAKWKDVVTVKPFLSKVVWDMVMVQWHTGMRSSEMCEMRAADLDRTYENDGIIIYRPPTHKTTWRGNKRDVVFGPMTSQIVKGWLPGCEHWPIFRNQQGRKFTRYSYYRHIRRGMAKAEAAGMDFQRWHPHQLRHSRATHVEARFGREASAVAIGDTIQVTDVYADRNFELAKKIAKAMG